MPDLFSLNENKSSKEIENPNLAFQQSTNYDLISNLEYKSKPIRRAKLEDGTEVWVVIDVIGAVTGSKNPTQYWNTTKRRMVADGCDGSTICLPMFIKDALGRVQKTQVMTLPQLLRMLQSLPSKKAEPFRVFMAEAGYTLIKEAQNPDLAIQRGYEGYIKKGKSAKWAKARVESILHRNDLTQKWLDHGVNEPKEFAMLTDRESKGTFGKTKSEMKKEKSLTPTQNLRDDMTEAEIAAQNASDMAISLLIDKHNPQGYDENAKEVDKGSTVGALLLEKFNEILKD